MKKTYCDICGAECDSIRDGTFSYHEAIQPIAVASKHRRTWHYYDLCQEHGIMVWEFVKSLTKE